MKNALLNERQFNAVNQIIELCTRISPDHWFTNAELYQVGSGTLGALEKKGYVIQKCFFAEQNTGFQHNLTHWQWTGKKIENELEQVRGIIAAYNKEIKKLEISRYSNRWDIDYCKNHLSYWEEREKELIEQREKSL